MTSFLLDVHVFGSAHVCSGNSYQIMVYVYFNGGTTMPPLYMYMVLYCSSDLTFFST